MGPLLRWSHSCLFVECPYFVPHPSSYPTNVPLLFLSVTLPSSCFYPKLHFPSGDLGPSTFEKKVTLFVIFLAGFSLAQILCRNAWRGNRRAIASFQFFIILWTNSSRGLGKGQRAKERTGSGHQQFFFCCCFI